MHNSYHLKTSFNERKHSTNKFSTPSILLLYLLVRQNLTNESRSIQSKSTQYFQFLQSEILNHQIASVARFDKDIFKLAQNRVITHVKKTLPLKIYQAPIPSIFNTTIRSTRSLSKHLKKNLFIPTILTKQVKNIKKALALKERYSATIMRKLNSPNVFTIFPYIYIQETVRIKNYTIYTRRKIILRRFKKYVIAIMIVLLFSRTFSKVYQRRYRRKSKFNTITQKLIAKQKEEEKVNVEIPIITRSPTKIKKKLSQTIIRISALSKMKAQPLFEKKKSFSESNDSNGSIQQSEEKQQTLGNVSPMMKSTQLVYRTSQINRALSDYVFQLKSMESKEIVEKGPSDKKSELENVMEAPKARFSIENIEIREIRQQKQQLKVPHPLRGHQRAKTEMDSISKEEHSPGKQQTVHVQESLKQFQVKYERVLNGKSKKQEVKAGNKKRQLIKGIFSKEREKQIEQVYQQQKMQHLRQNRSSTSVKNNFRIWRPKGEQ